MTAEALTARQQFEQRTGPYEHAPFGRVVTAMVTPFAENSSFNPEDAQGLAQFLVENGSEGLVLAGTTGESPALTHEEEMELFRAVREAVDVPILAGVGKSDTVSTMELAVQVTFEQLADGLLIVTPPYNRPTQGGLRHHFRTIASMTHLPVVVYDIPVRTGQGLEDDTLVDIASLPTVVAVKDATGSVERTMRLRGDLPEDFVTYSGDDGLNLQFIRQGAVGAISVASHWAGLEMQAMFDTEARGNHAEADRLDVALRPSYEFETGPNRRNPIATKALLRGALGLPVGYGRPPMVTDDRDLDAALEREGAQVYATLKEEAGL